MSALLVAGIGVFVAGLVAVAFGVPVKEFSFGNTMILSGAVVACTGMVMISLSLVIRELRGIARRLGPAPGNRSDHDLSLPVSPASDLGREAASGRLPSQQVDQPAISGDASIDPPNTPSFVSPPPWQAETPARTMARADTALTRPEPPAPVTPPPKSRRNLLFSSSSRKERERAMARSSDPATGGSPVSSPSAPEQEVSPPPSFDDAWPQSERSRADARRAPSAGSSAADFSRGDRDRDVSGSQSRNSSEVTVLKSGVVDGMAYSLYSDGSIEAQMPEGMMRFASIDELRAHLDQRP